MRKKKGPELADILTPLEHESRCNMFISEVKKISFKYPNLTVDVENTTTADGQTPEVLKGIITNHHERKGLGSFLKRRNRENDQVDKKSPFINRAEITVWGWDGEDSVAGVRKLALEIRASAKGFNGSLDSEREDEFDEKSGMCSIHLEFSFRS